MMPRFPGLSRVDSFAGITLTGLGGQPLMLGHGPDSEPRIPYNEPEMPPPTVVTGKEVAPVGTPSVLGATMPDLVILPGQAQTGGGPSVGTLAFLALFGVGGWFAWKKWGAA